MVVSMTRLELFQVLLTAVKSRQSIELEYDGKIRRVCPHLLGATKTRGR